MEGGLNMLHKILTTKQPLAIINQFNISDKFKQTDFVIYTKHRPKAKRMQNFFLYKITKIYNLLEGDI